MSPNNPNLAEGKAGRQHYPALDGLRGLAILLVVIYHNFGFIDYFFFGWLGVDLFFVLSGFLITDILLKTLGEKNYLKNFYIRRMLRIFPLYYLALVIFLVVVPRLVTTPDLTYYSNNQVWLWTYFQNWLYIFKPAGQTQALHHLWSLAVEEQFYLLWPLAILLIRKPRPLLVFISLLLIGVILLRLWVWNNQITNLAYFNLYTFSRIDGICIGCMVALIQRIDSQFLKRYTPAIVLFFAAVNFIFFFINRQYHFSFPYLALAGYTTFAMIFGLLVNEAVTGGTKIIDYIFSIPILKFFGKISYSFYILHWPLYLIIHPFLFPWLSDHIKGSPGQFTVSLITTLLAVLVSWLSYRYYERYFLKLKQKFA